MAESFLIRHEVEKRTVLAKSTLYAQIEDGTFPEPDKIEDRAVSWMVAEVVEWQRKRITEARK